ncbi:MAG: site-specific integrase [Gammaproteobacteria bacterium]|nr:site-specific integrase [Gammaproteobacteria bacterium]
MPEKHKLMGGKLHVYRRENSNYWQCSTFLDGKNWRTSTKEDSLAHAKDFAEDWYLSLKGKLRSGELKSGKSFKQAAALFEQEFEAITLGERSPKYVATLKDKIRVHLMPFFEHKTLPEITPGLVQQYRVHRMTSRKHPETGEPMRPARSTLHTEIITLRHILKTAQRHGWIEYIPDLSPPYKTSPKISHRAWFSPEEYKKLYEATRRRAEKPINPRWKYACEQMHDFVLFMVNTGLRPDEAIRLEYRDVQIVDDDSTHKTILEISVRGKRGVGYCKSMPGAVMPFERLKKRTNPKPTDLIFGKIQRELFNTILEEEGLKKDREGLTRTAYSLRHTYICLRLMEGADIYQVAKNCRTSVEMIEKFYASHIKDMIDASAVNTVKKRPSSRKPKGGADAKRKKGSK